jgi:hypothetical protein
MNEANYIEQRSKDPKKTYQQTQLGLSQEQSPVRHSRGSIERIWATVDQYSKPQKAK